ncbi:MAG: BlaI/MecI/CopY family transcriptional regulator [Tannerella sp.]|jgi:predicted transcriptional regulator|nr:BlaI/MecI/CopY family transcriptional regulator [Tannerella sp.]
MQKMTVKEEELMRFFWEKGALFVKDILDFYDEPKPHFNTLSTIVRGLEEKGFLAHKTYGNTYQYYAIISEEEYSQGTLKNVINKYFGNSYLHAVSSLIKSENISVDELRQLIKDIEKQSVQSSAPPSKKK